VSGIRVVLADDQPLFLQGVRAALEHERDLEIVGEAESTARVLPLVARTEAEFVLMDFLQPQLEGLACLDRIRARHPGVKVAMMSACREPGVIEGALRRGACAYVLKSINPSDLAAVIRQVTNGTVFQSLDLGGTANGNGNGHGTVTGDAGAWAGLTEREVSILQALARGLSNEAIAKELWITRQTVKFHVRNVYRKLGVANRTAAVGYAFQHGLVAPVSDVGLAVVG